jgi:predicted Rdx family selenoprotein
VRTTVTPGKRGQFDVVVGDRLVFSKHAEHRFPDPGEVEAALATLLER